MEAPVRRTDQTERELSMGKSSRERQKRQQALRRNLRRLQAPAGDGNASGDGNGAGQGPGRAAGARSAGGAGASGRSSGANPSVEELASMLGELLKGANVDREFDDDARFEDDDRWLDDLGACGDPLCACSQVPAGFPPGFPTGPPPQALTDADLAQAVVSAAVQAIQLKLPEASVARAVQAVIDQPGRPGWRAAVDRFLTAQLHSAISHCWQGGWQPVDLVRLFSRRHDHSVVQVVTGAIADELAGYAVVTLDRRWPAQLTAVGAERWWPVELGFLAALAQGPLPGGERGLGWPTVARAAVTAVEEFSRAPHLQVLGPLPGQAPLAKAGAQPADSGVDSRILDRVRALLAKAESTTFPAEAETFTAGAQALMARHSIDHAMLSASGPRPDTPTGRRVWIDNPYESPKATLLDQVGRANRCRVVWDKRLGFCTVIGFETDLDSVELLFTSLLLQATRAMAQAGSQQSAGGRSRTRSFRQAFLTAFALRIGERLTEATREQTAQAAARSGGQNLLPVLAGREREVEEAVSDWFPELRHRSVNITNAAGWASGRQAADLASLQSGAELPG